MPLCSFTFLVKSPSRRILGATFLKLIARGINFKRNPTFSFLCLYVSLKCRKYIGLTNNTRYSPLVNLAPSTFGLLKVSGKPDQTLSILNDHDTSFCHSATYEARLRNRPPTAVCAKLTLGNLPTLLHLTLFTPKSD